MLLIVFLDFLVLFDWMYIYKMIWLFYFCFIGNVEVVESKYQYRIDMNCNDLLFFFYYKVSENDVFFECKSFVRFF